MKDVLYAIVTADKYELPIMVTDHIIDICNYTGRNRNSVISSMCKGLSGKKYGYKIIRIPLEGEEKCIKER